MGRDLAVAINFLKKTFVFGRKSPLGVKGLIFKIKLLVLVDRFSHSQLNFKTSWSNPVWPFATSRLS